MDRHAERLGEHGAAGVQPLGERDHLLRADGEHLGEAAVGVRLLRGGAEIGQLRVEVVPPGQTLGQRTGGAGGMDGDRLPHAQSVDVGAEAQHPPGDLMAQHEGV